MNKLVDAIQSLKPGAEFSFTDNDYETIIWDVIDGEIPTLEEVENEIKKLEKNEKKEQKMKNEARLALFERLGISEEEAQLLK